MARLQSEIKRGFLRQLAEGAKANALTLREALLAFQSQIFSPTFKAGRILINTSGSGQSGSFAIPQVGQQFTQEQIFALSEEFIQVLDDTVAAGTDDAADAAAINALFAAMVDDNRLRGIRSQHGDFSGLNFPATSIR